MTTSTWHPRHDDPLFIMAMDHRGSFGKTLFGVVDDEPTSQQAEHMRRAKVLIYDALSAVRSELGQGRAGVLVDERYGQEVIDRARADDGHGGVVLAVPIEASGRDWFSTEWGDQWLEHVERIAPAYAKVLVRDNPDFDPERRQAQFAALAPISSGLHEAGVPFLYELLVPGTDQQLATVDGDTDRYDRDLRPDLVARVIADNQAHGVEPTLWKVEGLETVAAARQVAAQARSGGRNTDLIVLGRDAPAERVDHWLAVAADVAEFVGFAIGRSIWQDAIEGWVKRSLDDGQARAQIGQRYLDFAAAWR